jgi:hypothetical protein
MSRTSRWELDDEDEIRETGCGNRLEQGESWQVYFEGKREGRTHMLKEEKRGASLEQQKCESDSRASVGELGRDARFCLKPKPKNPPSRHPR